MAYKNSSPANKKAAGLKKVAGKAPGKGNQGKTTSKPKNMKK